MRSRLIIGAILTFLILAMTFSTAKAFNPLGNVCKNAPNSPACQQNAKQNGSTANPAVNTIRTAVNIIAVIGGIGSVIIIIYSGFLFVTAGGATPGQRSSDPNKLKTARSALSGALVGLVIIALSWVIVTFVTDRIIG